MARIAHKIKTAFEIRDTYNNWPMWFSRRLRFPAFRNTIEIKLRSANFLAPNTMESWCAADQTWREKAYTKHFQIRDGYRVLDVGAHFGFFSIYAASHGPKVQVISYEPAAENFNFLKQNILKNSRAAQIQAFNVGLSDKSEIGTLFNQKGHNASSTLFKEKMLPMSSGISPEQVRIEDARHIWTVFDSFDFAKFDCEGAEFPIFERLGTELKRFRHIVLEYHDNPEPIRNTLAANNFSILEIVPLVRAPWSTVPDLGLLYATRNS